MPDTIVTAAVQMAARLGDVSGNLERAERLVREAFRRGAGWVVLPEFFTSGVGYHYSLRHAALPPDGAATRMLCALAREHRGYVGGSFIAAEGGDACNRFVLAGPDGKLGEHDKDQPTMWENAYYVGGRDDGVMETPIGPVGAAVCWELVRTRTSRRLRGRVGLLLTGSCWWSTPDWLLARALLGSTSDRNRDVMRTTPGRFARMVGAPLVHAAHCGDFVCETPALPGVRYRSHFLGETQIVAADGSILARRLYEEGEGVVLAEVCPGAVDAADSIPDRFWIPDLPRVARWMWSYQNAHGVREYARVKAAGGFGWQQPGWEHASRGAMQEEAWPRLGGDHEQATYRGQ